MVSFEDFLTHYKEYFLPAYSDLVGYLADKPQQIIVEIENTFTHLMIYLCEDSDLETRDRNLYEAYVHLARVTLDCHKLLWVELNTTITKICEDPYIRKYGINEREELFIVKCSKFKETAKNARWMEIEKIGENPTECIELYKEANQMGIQLLEVIDEDKIRSFDRHRSKYQWKYWIKTNFWGLIIGIVSGLIVGILLPQI